MRVELDLGQTSESNEGSLIRNLYGPKPVTAVGKLGLDPLHQDGALFAREDGGEVLHDDRICIHGREGSQVGGSPPPEQQSSSAQLRFHVVKGTTQDPRLKSVRSPDRRRSRPPKNPSSEAIPTGSEICLRNFVPTTCPHGNGTSCEMERVLI